MIRETWVPPSKKYRQDEDVTMPRALFFPLGVLKYVFGEFESRISCPQGVQDSVIEGMKVGLSEMCILPPEFLERKS